MQRSGLCRIEAIASRDLAKAEASLDEKHHGLEKVKERVLELARMLGGQSEAAIRHAQALLK